MARGSKPGERRGGRQKGTPNKATADVKAVAQEYTAEAVRALVEIMRMSDSDAAKVSAIKELLDRGHGKARQSVDVDANVKAAVTAIEWRIVDPSTSGA
jgi:hypothetical protein